jgi:O-antigen ligase
MNQIRAIQSNHRYRQSIWLIWLILLVTLPVTSYPGVARFFSNTPVSPLALIPLAALSFAWLLPYLLSGGKLPAAFWPLLAFGLLALLSGVLALQLPLFPYKGQNMLSREIRALATLAFGLAFYLCASVLPSNEREIRQSLRAIYLGAFLTLAWSTLQIWIVFDGIREVPDNLNEIHRLFSIRDMLEDRVGGLAYEPSWLGNQLVLLYLPLLVSSVLRRTSIFPTLKKFLSVELFLALWSLAVLYMTKSRVSFLSLGVVVGFLYLIGCWQLGKRIASRGERPDSRGRVLTKRLMPPAVTFAGICVLLAFAFVAIRGLTTVDRRFRNLFRLPAQMSEIQALHPDEVGYEVANRLAFAERIVYWSTGYGAFERYPILGVGPGNTGFLFTSTISPYAYRLTEIRRVLDSTYPGFPNPKNLWLRLLAETGIVGASAFLAWIILLGYVAYDLLLRGNRLGKMIGFAGLMGIIVQLVEGFSLDSYALPQMWIIFGLLTAAWWRREMEVVEEAGAY